MPSGKAIILSDYVGGESAASGGAGHAALDSYRALRAKGVDVRVIAAFGTAPAEMEGRFTTLGGADLREAGAASAVRAIYNPGARRALSAALAGEDPDRTVIILHQWTRYLSPAAIDLLARFRLMIYMHDYFWACPNGLYYDFQRGAPCVRRPMSTGCIAADCYRGGRAAKLGRIARHATLFAAMRGAARNRLFLHLSEHAKRTAAPLLAQEHHAVIYNPMTIDATAPPPAPAPQYDFGYFGRLEPEKGLMALLGVAEAEGLRGLFVGQGALEAAVTARPLIAHRPWQPRGEMAGAMRSCRAIVLPSLWPETWGLIIPEAMAAGVPVLASSQAGSAELIQRFGGGAVFDPAVPGDLRAKLAEVVGSAPHADRAGLADFLSPGRHADRITALAAERWDIDLAAGPAAMLAPRPAASGWTPAVLQPHAM